MVLRTFLAMLTIVGFASTASAIVIDFGFEDDLVTPLVNGQIVDPAFDGADLEFGNLFTLTSSQIGPGAHNGATIFDSTPTGPNQFSQDPDLLVNRGNILILQSNNPASANNTSIDGTVGLVYDNPNDEADFNDRGALIFDFLSPVFLQSLDFIDANAGFSSTTILTDGGGNKRTFSVPSMWTKDIGTCGICAGWETLDLTSLLGQPGEGGGTATGVECEITDLVGPPCHRSWWGSEHPGVQSDPAHQGRKLRRGASLRLFESLLPGGAGERCTRLRSSEAGDFQSTSLRGTAGPDLLERGLRPFGAGRHARIAGGCNVGSRAAGDRAGHHSGCARLRRG